MGEAARALAAAESSEAAARARLAEYQDAGDGVVDRLQRVALESAAATAAWNLQLARENLMLAQARWLASSDTDARRHEMVLQQVRDLRREFSERLAGIETTKAQLRGVAKWLTERGNFIGAQLAGELPTAIDPEIQAQLAAIATGAAEYAGA